MNIFRLLITTPLGYILGWINDFVNNYGVAIILFTVLIKLILLPLGLKQQKSMTKMQRIQPKLKEIQEKYKYDQNKASMETMKLYKEYGVNPAGGCLPLLIQFPILIGLYQVIYRPLTYILHMSASKIEELKKAYKLTGNAASRMAEIAISESEKLLNFDFLGLNLSDIPWDAIKANITSPKSLALLIIPILAGLSTFMSSKITMMINKDKTAEAKENKVPERVLSPDPKKAAGNTQSAESMTNSMTYIMPFMTVWFALTLPSAMGLYWVISNVLSLGQTILLNGYYNKKLEAEISEQDAAREQKLIEKQKKYNTNKKKKRG